MGFSYDKTLNFNQLEKLLVQKDFKKANDETYKLIDRSVMSVMKQRYLPDYRLDYNFLPPTVPQNIDMLWKKYSGSRFGFGIQKRLYIQSGNSLDGRMYLDGFDCFSDLVGWSEGERWISYHQVIFHSSAPLGHLPTPIVNETSGMDTFFRCYALPIILSLV
ncbi:MAG: GUN4 domain-containing protein [Pseudanabaena sp.]|jgi:hypothetical protein